MDGDGQRPAADPTPPSVSAYRTLASLEADVPPGGAWKRVALWLGAIGLLAGLGYLGWSLFEKKESPPQRQVVQTVTRLTLPPPPPPPPPPKTDPPPPQPQKVEEAPRPTPKPDVKPPPVPRPAAPAGPPAGLGLPTGPGGANPYGIGAGGDGSVIGGTGTGGGGGGDAVRYFHQQMTQRVADALRRDERTRGSNGVIAVTFDDSGRIQRVQLARSTGDPARDRAIVEILTGIAVARPPPGNRSVTIELNENV